MNSGCESIIYGLLPHPLTKRVLILPNEDSWSLPSVRVDGNIALTPVIASRELSRILEFPVIAIRYESITFNEHINRNVGVFVLDGLEHIEALSQVGRWVGLDEISNLHFCLPDHLSVVNYYFQKIETAYNLKLRQPWELDGWYLRVTTWIEETLKSIGIDMKEKPTLVKWWSLSSVLKVATTQGDIYFKASAKQPLFVNEPILLKYLDNHYSDHVPSVIAFDPNLGWMLTKDFGINLGKDTLIKQKIEVLRVFGEIQIGSIGHLDSLLNHGCTDRRVQHLIPLIDQLLDDELVVSRLAEEEIVELRKQIPKIKDMCSKLLDYSVPATLVHGDLHLGNVAIEKGRLIYFDWTDACIAHPFMDMLPIFDERELEVRIQLRDQYLSLWIDFEPMHRLLDLWTLCEVVHAIHHALSYQSILHHTEERSRGELGGAPAFLLRKALQKLRDIAAPNG